MINIVLILVMLTAFLGAATYGLVSGMRALQVSIEKLNTEDRLEETAQAVLANIVSTTSSSTQTYSVPWPDTLGSYAAVPSWITPNAQTPRGVKFAYCPFSNISNGGTGSLTTITTPSSSYKVNLMTAGVAGALYTGSENYVNSSYVAAATAARPANASTALAIIVAPGPNQTAPPDCLSISATGTLAGAQVRIITENDVQSRAQVIASAGNEFYAAVTASGNGTGNSASNYALFSAIMTYVNQYRPQAVKIDMAAGTYSMTSNTTSPLMGQAGIAGRQNGTVRNHSILFAGAGSGSTSFQDGTASTTVSPVVLGNIEFQSAGMPANNGEVYKPLATSFGNIILDGVAMQYLGAYGAGKVYVVGTGTPGTTMSGSSTTGALGTEYNLLSSGGQFYLGGYLGGTINAPASANFNSTNGLFQIENGGRLVIGQTANYTGQGGDAATKPWFGNSRGGELIVQGTLAQTAGSNSGYIDQTLSASRTVYSGVTFSSASGLVDTLSWAAGLTALDRGTVIDNVTAASGGPNYIFSLGGGGEVDLTNSTAGNNLMGTSGILVNNAQHTDGIVLGGGATGGWTAGTLKAKSGPVCYSTTAGDSALFLTDNSTVGGTTYAFLPLGTTTADVADIILNRAGWTCN